MFMRLRVRAVAFRYAVIGGDTALHVSLGRRSCGIVQSLDNCTYRLSRPSAFKIKHDVPKPCKQNCEFYFIYLLYPQGRYRGDVGKYVQNERVQVVSTVLTMTTVVA